MKYYSIPVYKIVTAFDIALRNEEDLRLIEGEIDYESLSEDTLRLLYEYVCESDKLSCALQSQSDELMQHAYGLNGDDNVATDEISMSRSDGHCSDSVLNANVGFFLQPTYKMTIADSAPKNEISIFRPVGHGNDLVLNVDIVSLLNFLHSFNELPTNHIQSVNILSDLFTSMCNVNDFNLNKVIKFDCRKTSYIFSVEALANIYKSLAKNWEISYEMAGDRITEVVTEDDLDLISNEPNNTDISIHSIDDSGDDTSYDADVSDESWGTSYSPTTLDRMLGHLYNK